MRYALLFFSSEALFNFETSTLIQKRRPYTGNLNSETLGDSKNVFLHWGDGLGRLTLYVQSLYSVMRYR